MSDDLELVVIERAPDAVSAQLLAGLLQERGIPATVAGQDLVDQWAMSQRAMGLLGVDVRVPRARIEESLQLLRELQAGEQAWSPDADAADEMPAPAQPPAAAAVAPLPPGERRLLAFEILAVLMLVVVPSILASVLYLVGDRQPSSAWDLIQWTASGESGMIALLLYLMARSGQGWAHFGLVRPRWVADPLIALGVVALAVPLILAQPFGSYTEPYPHAVVRFALEPVALLYIASTCVSAFHEELLMRAWLLPRLRQLLGSTAASLLLGALLFGSMHIYQGSRGVVDTFILGLIFGGVFWTTRRIWPVAIAHAVFGLYIAGP